MNQKNQNISLAKKGMNRESAPYQLEETEYSFALNTNIQNETGNVLSLSNEHSNILASKFKDGFKVVGHRNNIVEDRTYFFLTNPSTGISEFGEIVNSSTDINPQDQELECNDCDSINTLSTPLEEATQVETQVYTTLLEDSCNLAFNFDIRYPMKGIEIKDEKCGETIYFTDALNPPRYIQRDDLEQYLSTGQEVCGDDSNVVDTCVDVEKMRIFKFFSIPEITPSEIILGGRLKMGTYEFLVAYCDNLGNEISEYYSVTNPISIFNENDRAMAQSDIANRTNLGIKLDLTNLDTDYKYYKIAVIQNSDIEGAVSYFIEGIHPTTDTTIIYNTEENKQRTDLLTLSQIKPSVNTWEGLTQANGYLFGYGITAEKELNLQPVVNLMGAFLKWQTTVAKEGLYEDGVATALYKGYHRDEVYPFSIRFLSKNGFKTALFPLIGRPNVQTSYFEEGGGQEVDIDEKDLVPVTKDSNSITQNLLDCTVNERTEYWEFYNTAKADRDNLSVVTCATDLPTVETVEEVEKISFQENITSYTHPNPNGFSLDLDFDFTTLEDFIEEYADSCGQPSSVLETSMPGICDDLDVSNFPQTSLPVFEGVCDTPQLIEQEIIVENIVNEQVDFIEKDTTLIGNGLYNIQDYTPVPPPQRCDRFELDSNGKPANIPQEEGTVRQTAADAGAFLPISWKLIRNEYYNTECDYAEVVNLIASDNIRTNNFQGYFFGTTLYEAEADIDSNKVSFVSDTSDSILNINGNHFRANVSNHAMYFRVDFERDEDIYFEITASFLRRVDYFERSTKIRFDIFNRCTSTNSLYGEIIDAKDGRQILIKSSELTGLTGNSLYVAIDVPIYSMPTTENGGVPSGVFLNKNIAGCYGVFKRDVEFQRVDVNFDSINFTKKETYSASCTFETPIIGKCDPIPYATGIFSYWESSDEYPDNFELYDSSVLSINPNRLSDLDLTNFEDYYTNGTDSDGNYIWKQDGEKPLVDFTCRNIRHFKFPDNNVAPFMSDNLQAPFSDSLIYPIGVTINENVVNLFLDEAVQNGLLTNEERDSLVGYEIFRGDRRLEKTILSKGLMFDMYSYEKNRKNIYFSNFPFNTLGDNELFYTDENRDTFIEHPFDSDENNRFTFHSPENHFITYSDPTEMKVEAYQFGVSSGYFSDIEDHPKWVILGEDAYKLANKLAIAEVVAEALVESMKAFANYNQIVGFANTVFSGSWVAAPVIAATLGITGAIFNYGKYRYNWLEIFSNLGQPENFASYFVAEGKYNYISTVNEIGNSLRGVVDSSKLSKGNFSTIDSDNGNSIGINNIDREESQYIYLGNDFSLEYPDNYKSFDNNNIDFNSSSRNTAERLNFCDSGLSRETRGKIASPYVSMKTYRPSQYGSVDSIKWVTTSYTGDLRQPKENCFAIFGGDVFINRMTLKRKTPMFVRNAMNQASLTPFNYNFYDNIGINRFYCNYLVTDEVDLSGSLFPQFESEYNFDCLTGDRDFYLRPPTKFYLFYYGIPNFLVESTINLDYRYAGKEPEDNFFPNINDIVEWTQEKNVSIREDNTFLYNFNYSKDTTTLSNRTLPFTYNKKDYDCIFDSENGVMYSLPDRSENDLSDPWLIYRPLDTYQFNNYYGKLRELRGIETQQVLARFDNQHAIFNAVDVLVDGLDSTQVQLGSGGIFARRPVTFNETDLGYGGSQTYQMVSNEFGHFFADAMRGQVFQVMPGGKSSIEISKFSGNKTNGMFNWFKEHLPFKILNPSIRNYNEIDTDNALNGVGITMGYDSRFSRVFLTKKDYRPLTSICYRDGKYFRELGYDTEISDKEAEGFTYAGIEECRLKFTKEIVNITEDSDVYAFFDTTSMQVADGESAATALQAWFADYQTNNPTYQGSLYILPYGNEAYLDYLSRIRNGSIPTTQSGGWGAIAILPPDLNTPQWVAPTDVLMLAFVDETNSQYHGSSISGGFSSSGIVQPTSSYFQTYQSFLDAYTNDFNFFKGVLYPIVQNISSVGGALVLQGLAAIEGTTLTQQQIDDTNTTVDVSILLTENPYSNAPIPNTSPQENLQPLKDLGWVGQYDKTSPASAVFSSQQFQDDLNNIISNGGSEESEEVEFVDMEEVQLTDTTYFEDCSFTVGYSLLTNSWLSYYSFQPNYYLNHNEYFQSGLNLSADESELGMWSHLLTNKSYQVFYGKKYPWTIEYPIKNEFATKRLENISIWLDVKRYQNDYDFAYHNDITFNKAWIYNNRENSGQLNLIPQKSLRQARKYPITRNNTSQDILITNQDHNWTFNYIYNRTKNQTNNVPLWSWDCNQINKTINNKGVSFYGKRVLEYLRGNWFLVRLEQNETSQYNLTFNWSMNKNEIY